MNKEKDTNMNKERIVYQYMSFDVFKKMLKGKSLKISDIKKSNDSTELQLQYEILNEALLLAYKRVKTKYMSKLSISDFSKLIMDKTIHIVESEKNIHTQYVICFSNNGDLLSQWRGYGQTYSINKKDLEKSINNNVLFNDSKLDIYCGVSIGFNSKYFNNIKGLPNISFDRVRYTKGQQLALLKEDADNLIKQISSYLKHNKSIDGFNWIPFMAKYEDILIKKGPLIKNEFFKEEREWRLCVWGSNEIFQVFEYEISKGMILSSTEYCQAKHKNKTIAPYYLIKVDKIINSLIKEVVIGPNSNVNKQDILKVLKDNNIDASVRYSNGYNVFVKSLNHKNKH